MVFNHPAFANKITAINDEVSIDFTWGLDETKEGYTGTMIIQEELSKHTKIYPIKTKAANEIATNLIDYFCTFGPSKRIRSDNEGQV